MPEKKKYTKRQLQALETKNKIYNAAVHVINEKGYNNVSIEDITNDADVAKGSFYTYFESKEALLFYTFQRSDQVYQEAYDQIQDKAFLPTVTHFVKISYTEYEKRGKGIIKAIVANYFSFPDYDFYGKDRILVQCLTKIVDNGKARGDLPQGISTDKAVQLLLTAMVGAEVMWGIETAQDEKLSDVVVEAVRVAAVGLMQIPV